MVIFHSYVSLPEGIQLQDVIFMKPWYPWWAAGLAWWFGIMNEEDYRLSLCILCGIPSIWHRQPGWTICWFWNLNRILRSSSRIWWNVDAERMLVWGWIWWGLEWNCWRAGIDLHNRTEAVCCYAEDAQFEMFHWRTTRNECRLFCWRLLGETGVSAISIHKQ